MEQLIARNIYIPKDAMYVMGFSGLNVSGRWWLLASASRCEITETPPLMPFSINRCISGSTSKSNFTFVI